MIERAIGFGLVVSLVFTEIFGLGSGGLVVPGYLALYLDQPLRIASTIVAALLTWATVKFLLSRTIILYGRRRFVTTVLCGFAISMTFPWIGQISGIAALLGSNDPGTPLGFDLRSIGHVIPGLLANEMLSAGPVPTTILALAAAVIVRILLFLTAGLG
jgi:poly-gamma-glutamate biosynthesis protein PgsC/CapC